MDNCHFSEATIKIIFEGALPNGIKIDDFRKDIQTTLRRINPAESSGGDISFSSPKNAFEFSCIEANLKMALKSAYSHKFEVKFYDLICLSILTFSLKNEMLTNFLCTEIIQTTSDAECRKIAMYYLQKNMDQSQATDLTWSNHGIHPALKERISSYQIFHDFLSRGKKDCAEVRIYDVVFNGTLISLNLFLIGEHWECGTEYPIAGLNIQLEGVRRITSDLCNWDEICNGYLHILPGKISSVPKEDCIDFSFISSYTSKPLFLFKCDTFKVLKMFDGEECFQKYLSFSR